MSGTKSRPEGAATRIIEISRRKKRQNHPWIFSNEIKLIKGKLESDDAVLVYEKGKLIGSGIYNPKSKIRIRLYSTKAEDLTKNFIKEKIGQANAYRKRVLPDESDYRLVYGESDSLPGLVIDKYGSNFVLQAFTFAMDKRLDLITQALTELFPVDSVFEKNDFRLRDSEGLERRERLIYGAIKSRVVIKENGARFYVDIREGQKTGYYFDQRIARAKVRQLAFGKSVLDVFCYTGGFTVNALLGGAKSVLAIDGSAQAIELAKENMRLNAAPFGPRLRSEFRMGDAFDALRDLVKDKEKFNLIILDPPPFIKSLKEKSKGIAGYKEINLQAMKLLTEGGILVTSSCSHYLFWQDFLDVLTAASKDAGKGFRIIDRTTQGPDHPILLNMPETEYLRSYFLEVFGQ